MKHNLLGIFLQNFYVYKLNIFNQFYLFQSSNKFGKTAKLNVCSEINHLSYKYKKKSKLNSFTGDDIIYLYSK